MKERLQKLIAASGLCSRRAAEEWIIRGKVTVNGGLARLGDTADPALDEIRVEGRPLPAPPAATTTVLLYKPRGVVTTLQDEKGRPTVAALLPPELGRLYPVGRLDQFSEGLLLMTNDGALANRLTHPKGEVNKTYRLWVSGWHEGALALLKRPIVLDGYRIKAPTVRLVWARDGGMQNAECKMQNAECKMQNEGPVGGGALDAPKLPRTETPVGGGALDAPNPSRTETPVGGGVLDAPRLPRTETPVGGGVLDAPKLPRTETPVARAICPPTTALLEITIHEGRNRQIRRMAEAAGLKTTRLQRVAEGPIQLGDLKPGQWRLLTPEELARLKMGD
jgi:pseudouridine synthase